MRDLSEVRAAYERGEGSLRILAARFGIPHDTLKKRCRKEGWTSLIRRNQAERTPDPLLSISAWRLDVADPDQWLIDRFGPPFVEKEHRRTGELRIVDFNYLYWAGRFSFEKLLVFDPLAKEFYVLKNLCGFWQPINRSRLIVWLSVYLLEQSRRFNQPILQTHRSMSRLGEMVMFLKGENEQPDFLRRLEQEADRHGDDFDARRHERREAR